MRKIIAVLGLMLLVLSTGGPVLAGRAGSGGATFNANTGDAAFNTTLGDLNLRTQGDSLKDFIANMSLSYNIPAVKIEDMVFKLGLSPADVYMTIGLSNIANKPVDDVLAEYQAHKNQGWGVIAQGLGVKPGSKEFQALKNGGAAQLDKVKNKGQSQGGDKGKGQGGQSKGKGKNN